MWIAKNYDYFVSKYQDNVIGKNNSNAIFGLSSDYTQWAGKAIIIIPIVDKAILAQQEIQKDTTITVVPPVPQQPTKKIEKTGFKIDKNLIMKYLLLILIVLLIILVVILLIKFGPAILPFVFLSSNISTGSADVRGSLSSAISSETTSTTSENYSHIPQQNGKWDGPPGDSNFYPDPDFVPKSQSNREHWSWRQILDYYKIDCIPFKNGYPVFPKKIVCAEVSLKNFSHKPDTDNRKINFIQADKEFARQKGWTEQEARSYRETNALTWHESEDCKTMQLVPTYVHNNIPHRGGISESKAKS